jgi:hypothetical protein
MKDNFIQILALIIVTIFLMIITFISMLALVNI